MRKQESQNKKVDQLAKRLMAQAMLSERDIDKIIASPMLYSYVRNKVNASPVTNQRFAWFRVPTIAAFASVMVVVGISTFVVLRQGQPTQSIARELPRMVVPKAINKVSAPDGFSEKLKDSEAVDSPQREQPRMQIQNASYRKPVSSNIRPPRLKVEKQPDLEFIPLVYTDDPAESVRGGRVIRVELSRASLFAMGINIPLENGAETVKADLLVGQDGVPRGIRMPQ